MTKKWLIIIVAAIAVAVILGSISWFIREKRESIQDLDLSIQNIRFQRFITLPGNLLPSAMELEIEVDAYNPNDVDIELYDLEYQIQINDIFVGNGSLSRDEKVKIPENESRIITILYMANLTTLPSVAITTIQNIIQNEESHWGITGIAYVETPLGKEKFTFSRQYPPSENQG